MLLLKGLNSSYVEDELCKLEDHEDVMGKLYVSDVISELNPWGTFSESQDIEFYGISNEKFMKEVMSTRERQIT